MNDIVENQFSCDVCGKSFNLLAKLAGHMLLKHDSVGMEEAVKRKMSNLFKEKESFVQSCLEVWNFCTHTKLITRKLLTWEQIVWLFELHLNDPLAPPSVRIVE